MRKDFLMVGDKFFYEIMGHYYRYNVVKLGNGRKVLFPVEKDSPVLNLSSIDDNKMTVVYLSNKNRYYRYYRHYRFILCFNSFSGCVSGNTRSRRCRHTWGTG